MYFHTILYFIYGNSISELTTVRWYTHKIYSLWVTKIMSGVTTYATECYWFTLFFSQTFSECIQHNGKKKKVDSSKQSSVIAKHSLAGLFTLNLHLKCYQYRQSANWIRMPATGARFWCHLSPWVNVFYLMNYLVDINSSVHRANLLLKVKVIKNSFCIVTISCFTFLYIALHCCYYKC